ncbi:copper homeostasis CutC domain-containing protein [Chytridium lagenaria]|nr:copper homeostasis CutC domain-containing protein [Chytridium lagenaria]
MTVGLEVCLETVESAITAANLTEETTYPYHGNDSTEGGDFAYTDVEFEIMKHDIEMAKKLNVQGVVFGILNPNGTVDKLWRTLYRLEDWKDIDECQDSGALEGLELLREVVKRAGKRIEILPGGGIPGIHASRPARSSHPAECDVPFVHMALMKTIDSPMEYKNPNVFMGMPGLPEYSRPVTDGDAVKQVVQSLLGKRD